MYLCCQEQNLHCDILSTSFEDFQSKPRLSGADYHKRAASQSTFKCIKGAYRRPRMWLGSNGERCQMAGCFKNQEGYLVFMKMIPSGIPNRRETSLIDPAICQR